MSPSAPSVGQVLLDAVAAGAVPNVAAIAADRDGVIFEGGAGPRVAGAEPGAVVGLDSHYRVMSMTKLVTTSVALQLVEQGLLDLDAQVERYAPDFARVQVLDGWDGDHPRLRAPATPATVRQLMTHTAGFSYWFWNADIVRWERATGTPNVRAGLMKSFDAPMVHDPGTAWEYGINLDWLGRVIEAVAGETLDVAVLKRVLGPLGMTETAYRMTPAQRADSVPVHRQADGGGWAATDFDTAQNPEYWSGGHGLYSTPRDYIKLQRAILRGGELDGTRILSEQTVEQMFMNQIGDLEVPAELATADPRSTDTFLLGTGNKYGFGVLLNTLDVPGRRRAFSGAWDGLANTHFWIDRTTGIAASTYSQFLPFATPPSMELYRNFERALYASLQTSAVRSR
jgi:methyl acetate hydrolase